MKKVAELSKIVAVVITLIGIVVTATAAVIANL